LQVLYILLGIAGALAVSWAGAFFYGWHSNAVAGTHYDIPQLNAFFKNQIDALTALIVNHSLLNTHIPWLDALAARFAKPPGQSPEPVPQKETEGK
jgi:hypothetical protein